MNSETEQRRLEELDRSAKRHNAEHKAAAKYARKRGFPVPCTPTWDHMAYGCQTLLPPHASYKAARRCGLPPITDFQGKRICMRCIREKNLTEKLCPN